VEQQYVEFKGIGKRFIGVRALHDVSFRANGGEVTALLGENGAGKSTLLKILSGAYTADEGVYEINGAEKHFATTQEAIADGVSIIYQERQLVKELTVAENIFMNMLPSNRLGVIDYAAANAEAQRIIDIFRLPIRSTDRVKELSVAHQQMVEIMKAVRRESNIIAFDEPTASLSETEINTLFSVIGHLRDEGKVILYVSHRLKELFQITDKIVVMKDGALVDTLKTSDASEKELIRLMVGRDIGDIFHHLDRAASFGGPVLEVRNISNDNISDISFTLHKGEVLGISGLVGAGRSEIVRAIFGADKLQRGEILIDGKPVKIGSPADAIRAGIGLCPEDRKDEGLVLENPIRTNISIATLGLVSKMGVIDTKMERDMSLKAIAAYNIKTHSAEKQVIELSGGNQQKVILGRWIGADLKVLILDEPTKGIDVGAKSEIYNMIIGLAKSGLGVIFISSELPEVLNICDNIIVVKEGRVSGTLAREDASEEKVLTLAM
jgi:ABC-type sugar transport system ATPase subunit